MSKVLVIGDPHEPVSHPAYLSFCSDLYEQWDCDSTVIIGDIADHQAISFHAANPNCPGPEDEYCLTYDSIEKWHEAFPKAKIAIGNHDERVLRLAEDNNIPSRYIRNFNDTWNTPGWDWDYEHYIDEVCYMHGTGRGGVHPAWGAISRKMCSVVMGHCHSRAGVKWKATPTARFFGLDTGCGIDSRAWQFAYNRNQDERPFLAAGVVIDGIPYSEPMPCDVGEKYNRRRF